MKSLSALILAMIALLCGCGSMTTPTPEEYAQGRLALAQKGDTEAAWDIAQCYLGGYGVRQDFAEAERWFHLGAATPERKAELAHKYAHGEGFRKDIETAARWYMAAGRPEDLFELAELYKNSSPAQNAKATKLYLDLLKDPGEPVSRLAQLELGNFVIDGIYSAGSDAKGRAQNLAWARMIAQELLGQKEYQIAVEYEVGREDLPQDAAMSIRYCKRAAAYNIDLAQHYYVEALDEAKTQDFSGYDHIAWTRLAGNKQGGEAALLKAKTASMTMQQRQEADAAYAALVETRARYGAYYPVHDPLRNPTEAALTAMAQDDPDVQLRKAFAQEQSAVNDEKTYQHVLAVYRNVRNHRNTDVWFVLGRYALNGTNGVPKDSRVGEYWLRDAEQSGSLPARNLLAQIGKHRRAAGGSGGMD